MHDTDKHRHTYIELARRGDVQLKIFYTFHSSLLQQLAKAALQLGGSGMAPSATGSPHRKLRRWG